MQIILFSALAGICGTGIGGILTVVIGDRSPSMNCWVLSFAGGVMTSIVCFGLIPEAIELSGITMSIIGLVLGVIIIMLLNRMVDIITEPKEEKLQIHQTPEELYHSGQLLSAEKRGFPADSLPDNLHSGSAQPPDRTALLRSGTLMLVAIALHNIPEGLAIGAGGSHDMQLGSLLALMIALHNIPEGMAIAAPLLSGGMGKTKVILLTALSGAPTLLGGILGAIFGNISDTAIALSLAAAGGAMLYVVFGEIIPQSVVMTKSRSATIVTLFGILIGLIVAQM